MDRAFIQQKYDISVDRLLDFMALMGDKSDNVPGISGVGPKTASKLLNEYKSLDNLLANLDRLKKSKLKENLIAQQEMALLSRDLIRLKDDLLVPASLADYGRRPLETGQLRQLYSELEFNRLLSELGGDDSGQESRTFNTDSFHLVNTEAALKSLIAELEQQSLLIFDTETTSLNPLDAELVGISLAGQGEEAWYIAINHVDEDNNRLPDQLELAVVQRHLGPLLANPEISKIAHNIKYDLRILNQHELPLAGPLHDTLLVSYLLDPSRRSQKLDDLCLEFLGLTILLL